MSDQSIILFIKGGNPYHDKKTGRFTAAPTDGPYSAWLPPSSGVESLNEARDYYQKHVRGVWTLVINRKAGLRKVRIDMRENEDHAYTKEVNGQRAFWPERAKKMSAIIHTLAHPGVVLENGNRDLFVERASAGGHEIVVLEWKESTQDYRFRSFHYWSRDEYDRLTASTEKGGYKRAKVRGIAVQKDETPIRKAVGVSLGEHSGYESPPNFPDLHRTSLAGSFELGGAHTGIGWPSDSIVVWIADLVKALGPGERWITVHPGGDGSKGVPVLIRENPDGTAHVIGGAGGKLNYLKLRGVKSVDHYREEVAEKRKARAEADKQRIAREKELGTHQSKQQAREQVKAQQREHEREFVKTVAEAMGWEGHQFDPNPYLNLSDAAQKAAADKHHRGWLKKAKDAVRLQRERLLSDADARAEALGEVPLEATAADTLSVNDLDPVKPAAGLGYALDLKAEAEKRGVSEADIQAEKQSITGKEGGKPKGEGGKSVAERVARELDEVREPGPVGIKAKLADARQAVELLKAEKKLKAIRQQARDANKEIDRDEEPKGAYVLEAETAKDEDVAADLESDLRTIATRNFLSEAAQHTDLGRHVGVGAYNAVNAVSLTAAGAGLMDRQAVDVLGIAGAAKILAHRLHADISGDELEDLIGGLEEYHADRYMQATEQAMTEAAEWQKVAEGIELEAASNGGDLVRMQELNRKRMDAIDHANRLLGTTLGEMEANAAILMALKQGAGDKVEVALGDMTLDKAILQARAIGLDRGEYAINSVGGQRFLTIGAAGMEKLARPVNRDDLRVVRENLDIIEGRRDEDDWLPAGVADRPDLAMRAEPGVAPRLAEPFAPGPDMERAVRDYIGGRTADGDAPADIVSDLLSQDMLDKAGDRGSYLAALEKLAPMQGEDGKMLRAEAHQAAFERMADEFVADHGGDRSPLHRQTIDVDQTAVEALHRALSTEPAGVLAYRPVGDLTAKDQGALRNWWWANIGQQDEKAAGLRAELAEMDKQEPEREVDDMFGRAENPVWRQWRQERDAKAEELNASGLTWAKYAQTMGGPAKAYAAVQDLVRGRVAKAFHDTYNTLRPGTPLKLGRTVIAGNLNHLDAVDPEARERRVAEQRELVDSLRERVAGRYAAGAVADKLDARREEKAAFEQSQMGFFAAEPEPEKETPLAADQRHTLGQAAEQKLAGMMSVVGANFKPNEPTRLWKASMNGKYINQQRAIKLLEKNRRLVLAQGVGSGKAQPLDAKVLTPTGWKLMGDIRVGDMVVAGDGTPTAVIGVYPQGIKPIYRVRFADGGSTECCDEHLWATQTAQERKNEARAPINLKHRHTPKARPLSEIRVTLMDRHIRNHAVRSVGRVQFVSRPTRVDPYLLGVLLGDGGMSIENAVRLTNPEPEIIGWVRESLPEGVNLFAEAKSSISYRITSGIRGGNDRQPNTLVAALASMGLMGRMSHDKFIPDEYLVNSEETRLSCLRGIMDTDGTVSSDGHVTLSTASERLAHDVIDIVQSLGGIATLSTKEAPKYTHNGEARVGRPAHIITLRMPPDINPFRLPRKAILAVPKTKYAPRHRIIDQVELVGEKEAQCIVVEHPSHLYVTDDFLVTHNTVIGLGGFTHLHAQGKTRRGLFVVPSIVQGQFNGEALRYLEPGKYRWHIDPGASREARLAAYRDPENHFSVVTHQSFRDDMLHLGASQAGMDENAMAEKVNAMTRAERKAWMRGVMDAAGIDHDYLMVDEGHDLLNRAGKANSTLSNVVDAVSDNVPNYVNASADPAKNDPSEIFSLLQKMDPDRYTDARAFLRKYGVDTPASRAELRRELARYFYPGRIESGVRAERKVESVPLTADQHAAIKAIDKAAARARLARMRGQVDVEAMKALSPASFEGVPEARHEALASRLQDNLGILKDTAHRKAINEHPNGVKPDAVARIARERAGKPGIVFAHSLEAVKAIADRLKAEGHRVVTLTGADSSQEKGRKKLMFNPEAGEAQADILVASDAAAVGFNGQRGRWLVQADTPDTAKGWHQRNGRIDRLGQKNDIELIDLVADHPVERRARDRLVKKDDLRGILTAPLEGLDDTGLAAYLNKARMEREQARAY